MREQESLGRRLGRFGLLVALMAAVTGVVVVTQRLSDDALALLVGLSCGVTVLLPALALMMWLWRRQEARLDEVATSRASNASPPVIVVAPALPPGYGMQRPALPDETLSWASREVERKFTVVGGED